MINKEEDGKCDRSGDRQGPAIGWLENSRKGAVSPPGAVMSLAAIAAKAMVLGGFKRLILE